MAQTRASAIIGPSLWNQLLPSTRSTLFTGEPRQCLFSYQEPHHITSLLRQCLFSISQDCSLLSGSLALEALWIGLHCKKRYINVYIQYNTILWETEFYEEIFTLECEVIHC